MFEKRWLKEGEKTKVTDLVKKEAFSVSGEGKELIINLIRYLQDIKLRRKDFQVHDNKDKRALTAEQLLNHKGSLSGCIRMGTVFRALCIARGIPAIFVETLSKDWLDSKPKPGEEGTIEGHIFVDVFVEGKWYTVDPYHKKLRRHGDYYYVKGVGVKIGMGKDSFDIGFKTQKLYRKWVAKKFNKPYLLK